jgi:AraC-like DNA-binding protein
MRESVDSFMVEGPRFKAEDKSMYELQDVGRAVALAEVASCSSASGVHREAGGLGDDEHRHAFSKWRIGAENSSTGWLDVSRWAEETAHTRNMQVEPHQMLVVLCLRQSLSTISANGTQVHRGVIDRGAVIVVPPGLEIRTTFHTPAEFLYIRVPSRSLHEWLESDEVSDTEALCGNAPLHIRDPVVIKLTGTLLHAFHRWASRKSIYADSIMLSILARIFETIAARVAPRPVRASSVSPLEAWRVKIAIDFIDQRIDRSLTLAELGASVGLSPMHFAARFRAATGLSPHTFILRRRIEHAQTLLATTSSTVADIAFSVGFRTQAHFTTVFRRHVDDTPHRWRAKHGATQRTMARVA